jgi:hypothetical protein
MNMKKLTTGRHRKLTTGRHGNKEAIRAKKISTISRNEGVEGICQMWKKKKV